MPAYCACLFGVILQYLLSGLVQLVLAARAKQKPSLSIIFVGANGVEIIETVLKGTLAFLLAFMLDTTDLVQFKSADQSSLSGFAILGFLIGFWQLKPLWDAIRNFSKATAPTGPEEQSEAQN